MAYNVRVFRYRGMRQIQHLLDKQFTGDAVFVLDEPYIGSEVISVSAVAASSAPFSNDGSTIMRLEVPDGQQVRYEINPNGPTASNARVAGNASPRTSGFDNFQWAPGYTISLIDAAGLL
jgi:hypothetical protein